MCEKAVEVFSTEDLEERADSLNIVATLRYVRYDEFDGRENLERAFQEVEAAVRFMPVEKMSATGIVCCLSYILMSKYQNDGFEEDIERAIALAMKRERAFNAEHPLVPRTTFTTY